MIEHSRRDPKTRSELRQGRDWFARWKGVCDFKDIRSVRLFLFFVKVQLTSVGVSKIFQKLLEKGLDLWGDKNDISISMPAEPLSSFGNLMLNSGGFFYAWTVPGKEFRHVL